MITNLRNAKVTRSSDDEGFTLLELLIVIVVVGILAAIAIPLFANQQRSAYGASLKSDVRNSHGAVVDALVKNPTLQDVSGVIPTSSPKNTVKVEGTWDDYTITATNPDADPQCWQFKSATGRSGACQPSNPGGQQPGGGNENPQPGTDNPAAPKEMNPVEAVAKGADSGLISAGVPVTWTPPAASAKSETPTSYTINWAGSAGSGSVEVAGSKTTGLIPASGLTKAGATTVTVWANYPDGTSVSSKTSLTLQTKANGFGIVTTWAWT